ncbi:hypothetical protein K1720_03780 [Thermococcus argininiproducens]|uniref:Histone deacetylase domain-containing protein n=2 Tax=Thermococcus argininiproducens TaxID=2866384 RepID=A0A9E7MC58_9EURY|nr:hypothetical protein K1720_03780 [Thermococcus argininiproducens]
MPHYSKDDDYIFVWQEIVLPILENIKPKILVVSAGFDAFKGDGLATIELSERFYHFAGASLSRFSLAVILEGGYSVGLRKGFPAFIGGYLEGNPELENISPKYGTIKVVGEVREIQGEWWGI